MPIIIDTHKYVLLHFGSRLQAQTKRRKAFGYQFIHLQTIDRGKKLRRRGSWFRKLPIPFSSYPPEPNAGYNTTPNSANFRKDPHISAEIPSYLGQLGQSMEEKHDSAFSQSFLTIITKRMQFSFTEKMKFLFKITKDQNFSQPYQYRLSSQTLASTATVGYRAVRYGMDGQCSCNEAVRSGLYQICKKSRETKHGMERVAKSWAGRKTIAWVILYIIFNFNRNIVDNEYPKIYKYLNSFWTNIQNSRNELLLFINFFNLIKIFG